MNIEDIPWYGDDGPGMEPYLQPMSDDERMLLQILELHRLRLLEKTAQNPTVSHLPVEQDCFDTRITHY